LHYELQRIRLELQGPKPITISTRLGIHITLILSKTRALIALQKFQIHETPKFKKRQLLSPLFVGTLQALEKAKIATPSIQQAKIHEVTTKSIEVQLNPAQPIFDLITPYGNLQNKDYEIYTTYEQIIQKTKEHINKEAYQMKGKNASYLLRKGIHLYTPIPYQK